MTGACVAAVSLSADHNFSKQTQAVIRLLAGEGVEGDAHRGRTTQHLYLKRRSPGKANLTQVHLIGRELLDEFAAKGHIVAPGEFGENILTSGLDLLGLPLGAVLNIGTGASIEITGLRTPCSQIDGFQHGLQKLCWSKSDDRGKRIRRAGIMGIVLQSGEVKPGDAISVELPHPPHRPLPAV